MGYYQKKTLVASIKGTKSQDIIDVLSLISLEKRKLVKEITGHIKKLGRIYNFEEKVTDGFFNIFFFSTRRFTVTF